MSDYAVRVEGLVKRYGQLVALDGIDFEVPHGTVFGLLGPNGAGKTTAVRILATILQPDGGQRRGARATTWSRTAAGRAAADRSRRAVRGGRREPHRPREPAHGRACSRRCRRPQIMPRAAELLERFELTDAADRPVRTYSGGMRRRLDLAASLVHASAGAVPGRAHDRPRPPEPQRAVGHDRASWSRTARPSC